MEEQERFARALADRYRIEREIGEGGMATVFLAHDLKHHRKVAVKVLKPGLAAIVGARRFLAEIETTAKLIHPHILPLYDSGEVDGFLFFVMPFVRGESLRDRLDREHQLPVAEAVRIVSDVAEGLGHAHRAGVVHRDIKPANILMHEGRPLIADFGIALAAGSAGAARLTESGISVGTPYYMSPEQATGDQVVGPASDIFALGCMLFELLVGEPPYVGANTQAILGKIISGGYISATDQRPSIPPNVDGAIRKALEKLPADRFQSARGFSRALADPTFRHGERATVAAGPWKRIALAATSVAVVFALTLLWSLTRPPPQVPSVWIPMGFPEDQALLGGFDISADGTFMVYAGPGQTSADTVLWYRRFDTPEATPLPNSRTSYPPAISPDGNEVAFFDGETIRTIPLNGGTARSVGGKTSTSGVFRWSPDSKSIYFHDNIGMILLNAPIAGGEPKVVKEFPSANSSVWMYFDLLPSGKGAVVEVTGTERPEIETLDLETGETTPLIEGQFPRYGDGQLFFMTSDSVLMRMPFDPERMVRNGNPEPVDEGVLEARDQWWYFATSRTGRLLYATGAIPPMRAEFVWVTRDGSVTPVDPGLTFNPGYDNRGFSLDRDGSALAYSAVAENGLEGVFIKPFPRGAPIRLDTGRGPDVRPRWTPGGDSVVFISLSTALDTFRWAAFSMPATGSGKPRELLRHTTALYEAFPSPDGHYLAVRSGVGPGSNRRDILGFELQTDSLFPVTENDFNEKAVSFSPDGRFILYQSDESSRDEIYVRSFHDREVFRSVSTNGGSMPLWSHEGDEIFYVDPQGYMTVARVEVDPDFRVTSRDTLFRLPEGILTDEWYTLYELAPEDDRFLMIRVLNPEESRIELFMKRG